MITCHRCGTENDESQKNCVSCLVPLRQRVSVSSSPAAPVSDDPYAPASENRAPPEKAVPYPNANNPYAVAALTCGLLSLCCCFLTVPAIVLGHLGSKFAREQEGNPGKGMSTAGLILGYIGLAFILIRLVIVLVTAAGN